MPTTADRLQHNVVSRLRLRQLSLLLTLERQRSLSRAAAALNLSQPAITKALREIEAIFLTPLFLRSRAGLEATETGQAVLAYARLALADAEALGRELAVLDAGLGARLRIGIIPFVSATVLDAACSHALTQRPRIAVMVREGTTDELVAALRAHELDCVIARSFYAAGEDVVQVPLYREEPTLVVSASAARGLARGKLDWKKLAALDWILPPPHTPTRRTINTMFAVAGVAPPLPLVETYSIKTMETLLRTQARAIAIVPRAVATELASAGAAMLPHPLSWDLPPVGAMWLRRSQQSEPLMALVRALQEAMR
ncbi:DNA-binding transcriptional LysR family regulator [Cupriavidus gilardii J11]|uniref:DNA-binding transcriptional LysR family regulator n=1 Tax=Cupriavidus gilardii J11 TaxID=936133 RepID=A0A562BIL0_9BURK|nr:LysR family transcriptional regulator [Cupriavidus gilardii]TWG84931.1 DNA-binding transcriptional LysR family regulator [Cupriavidus gilardii J11]